MTELYDIAVIALADLAGGVTWVPEALGVEMSAAANIRRLGTHNDLVWFFSGPDVYLEVDRHRSGRRAAPLHRALVRPR